MSLASRLANFLSSSATSDSSSDLDLDKDNGGGKLRSVHTVPNAERQMEQKTELQDILEVDRRPPYIHVCSPVSGEKVISLETRLRICVEANNQGFIKCMLAGGVGGTTGDLLMHSLDTVKTRQQGDPHFPPKYTTMSSTYATIFRQEGIRRGLYGGVLPAFLGSFPGTVIFFGTYEYVKRNMINRGINASVAYFTGGLVADLAASVVYVPSEVLKTRLQLQGRYNNPFFYSGYNYRSTLDAARTIIRQEGLSALFYGYKATLCRDLPFSALQFAFYEKGQKWSKDCVGSRDIGLPLEILTAASAGGLAGVITCPLDVVKTRVQTQLNPTETSTKGPLPEKIRNQSRGQFDTTARTAKSPRPAHSSSRQPIRAKAISPSTTAGTDLGTMSLNTTSIITGLKLMYKAEGLAGWFRGVGPRFVWTSVQSTTMLVLYQIILRQFEAHPLAGIGNGFGGAIVSRPE